MKIAKQRAAILLFLVAIMAGCSGQEGPSTGPLVITNGTVIDGTGADPIENGIVVIEGDRITFVGSGEGFSIPRGAQVIDAHGGTVLPGFIDSHVHTTSDPTLRREFLIGGVTAVCDLGTPLYDIEQFDEEYAGDEPAARGYKAGPIITAIGGMPDAVLHANLNYEVSTPEEGRAAVVDLHDRGADMIKVYLHRESGGTQYPMLDEETLAAIVAEAHSLGLLVRAHVTYMDLFDMALSAGVDTIEHIPINSAQPYTQTASEAELQRFYESDDPLQVMLDEFVPEYKGQLETMASSGIIMVPTLDRPYGNLFRVPDPIPDQSFIMEMILGIVRTFHEMGGIVALGTDFNIGVGWQAGIPLGEIEMLLAAGLTPMEVIVAGTRNAAAACGQADDLGTLEPGMLADVIVVDGNPLEDYQVLANVVLVVKNGEIAFSANTD
jgi:imidazolonepropionase-like amidohydrolase